MATSSRRAMSHDSSVDHEISIEQSYAEFPLIEEAFLEALDVSLGPRGPASLLELVAGLGLPVDALALDVGCGEGDHCIELAQRLGFQVHGVDPVERHVELAREAFDRQVDDAGRGRFSLGSAEALPVDATSVDLVFCNEATMYVDLGRACAEFRRVLRPGGLGLIHQVFTGLQMRDEEAEAFWPSLGAAANSVRPQDVEAAITAAGLTIDRRIEFGSEWGEWAQEDRGAGGRRLVHAARLLREPERYVRQFGPTNYRVMLGDALWHVYRMIGKLEGVAFIFTKPRR
jgi:SAM-dependent methyltransferase